MWCYSYVVVSTYQKCSEEGNPEAHGRALEDKATIAHSAEKRNALKVSEHAAVHHS